MKCEICKTIERLGLDSSAHDLWYCADGRTNKFSVAGAQLKLKLAIRSLHAFFLVKRRQGARSLAHYRPRLVTLGI